MSDPTQQKLLVLETLKYLYNEMQFNEMSFDMMSDKDPVEQVVCQIQELVAA